MGQYADLFEPDDPKKIRADFNLINGVKAKPDVAAAQTDLAKKYGLPVEVIQQYHPDYEAQAKADDAAAQIERSPALRSFLADDDNRARIVHDDLHTLSGIEEAAGPVIRPIQGPKTSISSILSGLWSNLEQAGVRTRAGMRTEFADLIGSDEMRQKAFSDIAHSKLVDEVDSPDIQSLTGRAVYGGVSSTLQQIPGLAASIITRNPSFSLASGGLQVQSEAYGKYRERGGSAGEAVLGSSIEGAIEVATEKVPLVHFLEAFGMSGKGAAKQIFKSQVEEQIGEQLATFFQDMTDTAIANPDKTWDQYWAERPAAAYETFVSTLVQSGIMGGAHAVASRMDRTTSVAEIAKQHAEAIGAMVQLAEASKTRERSLDTFQDFAQELTRDNVDRLHFDPQALTRAGVNLEDLAKTFPSLMGQIHNAALGGDITIPTAEFLSKVPGESFAQTLVDHARTSADAMSKVEAEEFMQTKGEKLQEMVGKVLEEKRGDTEFNQSKEAIKQTFLQDLNAAGRFNSQTNEQYATLLSNFYAVTAARLGMTPEALLEKKRVKVAMPDKMDTGSIDQSMKDFLSEHGIDYGASHIQRAAIANQVKWTEHGTHDGMPTFGNSRVSLALPKDVSDDHDVFYKALDGHRALKYDILNADKQVVGHTVLEVSPDNKVTRLLDIEVKNEHRKQGTGEAVVAGLIHDTGELGIWHPIDQSRAWWEGRHAELGVNDGSITWDNYVDGRAGSENQGALGSDVAFAQSGSKTHNLTMVASRGTREVGKRTHLSDSEVKAIDDSASATGLSKKEITKQVKAHKYANPPSQGWHPLEFVRVKADTDEETGKVKYDYQYKTIPYSFSSDANGKALTPGTSEYDARVKAVATSMADEVSKVYLRAENGDKNAKNMLSQAAWYKAMRSSLRHEFGGLGDLFADLLGATSPNTPVRDNWKNATDSLRRAMRGDFDELIPKWEAWQDGIQQREEVLRGWYNERIAEGQPARDRLGAARQARDQFLETAKDRGQTKANAEASHEFKALKDTVVAASEEVKKYSKKSIESLPEYGRMIEDLKAAKELPENMLPAKETGKKYGFNGGNIARAMVDLWRTVKDADPDINRGGTAPKAVNFSGNLIGFRERATIDVWAARMLQRLSGGRRVPSMAESGVSGEMKSDGSTTLQFGFGQDVFSDAVRQIRADEQMSTNKTLAEINDDDLQAVVWFVEKELWTVNNWTSAAGEGGSFELEANLTGSKHQDKITDLRKTIDSSKSTAEEKATAKAELAGLERTVDRFSGGLSTEMSMDNQGVDYVPTDSDMVRLSNQVRTAIYSADDGRTVLASKALTTTGRYGSLERSLDLEVVAREGFDPSKLWHTMLTEAMNAKQDSTYLTRVLRSNETVDPLVHRPGIELYFRDQKAGPELEAMLAKLADPDGAHSTWEKQRDEVPENQYEEWIKNNPEPSKKGIEYLTVIVDGRRSPEAVSGKEPPAVGVRAQFVPEFMQRYGAMDFKSMTDDEIRATMLEQHAQLEELADQLSKQVDGVSFAGTFWHETQVAFSHEYQEKINEIESSGSAEGKRGKVASEKRWAGQPIREGVESADRQSRETSGREPDGQLGIGGDAFAQSAKPSIDTSDHGLRNLGLNGEEAARVANNKPITYQTHVDVDGVQRHALNSNGKPIAQTEEGVRNFWRWFGDSKVVDAEGKPLVVYHGTGADIETFKEQLGGIYLAIDGRTSEHYSALSKDGKVMLLYAKAEHLFSKSTPDFDAVLDRVEKDYDNGTDYKDPDDGEYMPLRDWVRYGYLFKLGRHAQNEVMESLRAEGFDAVRYIDASPMTGDSESLVVFDSTQIKSAIGNSGEFDPGNPSILHQSSNTNQTDTPQFKAWFGDSKVTDEKGKPLVVYHGTQRAPDGIDVFDGAKSGAIFFSESPDYASGWASVKIRQPDGTSFPEQSQVVPSYLSLKNPYDANTDKLGIINYLEADFYKKSVISKLKKKGYDGAFWTDVGGKRVFIAFQPEQIKSATGNSGEFNPNNPSILKQTEQHTANVKRGGYSPISETINLFAASDLSTFIHESGHFFMDLQTELGWDLQTRLDLGDTLTDNEQELLNDTHAMVKWAGMSMEDFRADTNEYKQTGKISDRLRAAHEAFAEGFEKYALEGKAPSLELQGVFNRFRAWMLGVYKSLKDFVAANPGTAKLNDEIRSVMDRMLASDEQIKEAEAARSMGPMFNANTFPGSAEEFKKYHDLGADATQEAINLLQARSIHDMQWLDNARSRMLKKLQRQHAELRSEMRKKVADEIGKQKVYVADSFLRYGTLDAPEDETNAQRKARETAMFGSHKLDLAALKEMYGEEANAPWRYLAVGKTGIAGNEGIHPDIVAEMLGYSSGDELVRALLAMEPRKDLINKITDERMLAEYGDVATIDGMQRAADDFIHSDMRERFMLTELKALQRATNVTEKQGRSTVNILARAAKDFAEQLISRTKVRDLNPQSFAAAAQRAGKKSMEAFAKADTAMAAQEKQNQIVQSAAAKAAFSAKTEIESAIAYLRRFDKQSKTIDADYYHQIEALLERFDLKKTSLGIVDERKTLQQWIDSQRDQGIEPDIPIKLMNEAYKQNYRDLTLEDIRGLRDTVKQIEHLGRLKHKLLTAKDQREYEVARDAITDSINEHAGDRTAETRTRNDMKSKFLSAMKRFGAAHIKAATWARIFDGGKDGGPVWEYFIRTANDRANMESTMRAEATEKLHAIIAPLITEKMNGKKNFFESVKKSFTREEIISMALNMGNEGNIQRMLGGEGWSLNQIQPILATLTESDWNAVQAIWDHFESYKPLISAKQMRVYGKDLDYVDPMPFQIRTADGKDIKVKGGYYPIKYDPKASVRAEQHNDAEDAKRQMQGAYTTATTKRGFTKARAEEVTGRPILYSMSAIYSSVNDVIHDLAWHEWLIDTNKLLRSEKIDEAIRSHYGPEVVRQFKSWVDAVAVGESKLQAELDSALGRLRQGVSAAGLSFNVMSAIMQPLGITQSIVRVGAGWVGKGIGQYLANPVKATRQVNEKSEFMNNRARTRFRELNELRNQIDEANIVREALGKWGYWMMMKMQQTVDVPTWLGAYEKSIADGDDESKAIDLADQAVIDSQGGGETKDLSAIERGGPGQKLFTAYYSFMNTALNAGVSSAMTPKSKGKLAADMLMLYSVPAVLGYFLKNALTPGDSGDDDWEKISKKLAGEQLSYLLGLMVIVRETSAAAKLALSLENKGHDYSGPAGVRMLADLQSFSKQVGQHEFDMAFFKTGMNLTGDVFGLPSAQINRTVTGAKAIAEGKTVNPASLVFGFQEPH